MPTPDRFISVLRAKRLEKLEAAVKPGKGDQTEFGYGKACGVAEGLELAEELWENQTAQEES